MERERIEKYWLRSRVSFNLVSTGEREKRVSLRKNLFFSSTSQLSMLIKQFHKYLSFSFSSPFLFIFIQSIRPIEFPRVSIIIDLCFLLPVEWSDKRDRSNLIEISEGVGTGRRRRRPRRFVNVWKGTYLSSHIDGSLCKTSVRIGFDRRLTRGKKRVSLSHQSSALVLRVQLKQKIFSN